MTLEMAIKGLEILKKAAPNITINPAYALGFKDAYNIISERGIFLSEIPDEIERLEAMIESELSDD